MIKSYSELIKLKTFEERYNYLRTESQVGAITFGHSRFLNQRIYNSSKYKKARREVILRDNACDLGIPNREIRDKIIVHHINPLTLEDIECDRDCLYDKENLICTTHTTHNAIHYSDENHLVKDIKERTPGDTCPWK